MQKQFLVFILSAGMMTACTHVEPPKHEGNHHHGDGHQNANEHMHEKSTEDLIKQFDSEERDAYQQPEKVLDYLGDLNGKTVMDIGAGSGYFSFRLLKRGAHVIAADVDEEFQQHIQKRKETEFNNDPNLELRKLPYDSPELKDGEVDMVLIVNTYHHIENRVDYFKKVLKGLKPGGKLVIIDYYKKELPVGPPADHKIDEKTVLNELKQAGYTDIKENDELLEYQYIIEAK